MLVAMFGITSTSSQMDKYIIIAICKGIYSKTRVWGTRYEYCDETLVKEDELMLLVNEDGGVTTMRYHRGDPFRLDAFVLESELKASDFAKNWIPYPWWCKPKRFEIIKIKPLLELRTIGYIKA